jgi:hypothetical protein
MMRLRKAKVVLVRLPLVFAVSAALMLAMV